MTDLPDLWTWCQPGSEGVVWAGVGPGPDAEPGHPSSVSTAAVPWGRVGIQ